MPGLIERAAELAAVEAVLADAEGGAGCTLLLEGQSGVGKSSLVAHAREVAQARGFTVLHACPTPVSSTLAHSVVRDWTRPLALGSVPGEKPFDGPATGLAQALSESGPDHQAWSLEALGYATSWLLENLCEIRPVLLVVDDVQWADSGSLQLLDLLAARVPQLPVVLLLARRTGEAVRRPDILDRISVASRLLTPAPLSVAGVDRMRRELPTAPATTSLSSGEVHRLTGGIPFLVRELLRAGHGGYGAPRPVVQSVHERLARLGDRTADIARTIAVLGDEASFDAVATLCDMSVAALADPLEVLTDADLVTLGLWRVWPSHPLVSEAILAAMTPSARSEQHRRAADHLTKLGRPRQVIASHLLHTLPADDHAVVDLLRTAAQESLDSGASQVAAAQLLRAVGETRPDRTDPQLLRLTAAAHMRAGLPAKAFELWDLALARTTSVTDRATCLADIGDAHMKRGDRPKGRAAYAQASRLLGEHGHDEHSQTMRLVYARMGMARAVSPGARPAIVRAITEATRQPQDRDSRADRLLFGLAANRLALEGADCATARALARRAEAGGRLLAEETPEGNGFYMAMAAFIWTDSFRDGLAALDCAVEQSRATGSSMGFATASYCRGYLHFRAGNLRSAVEDLDAALAMRTRGWSEYTEAALAVLTFAHVALGQFPQAEQLEPELRAQVSRNEATDVMSAFALVACGLIQATRGEHESALSDYRAAGEITAGDAGNPAFVEWRELAAWSLVQLGRRAEANAVAEAALARSRAWGSPRSVGFSLYAHAQTVPAVEAVRSLREAVELFTGCGAVDQLARAQINLGTLLARSSTTRTEGVELLQEALAYGRRTDVPPVVQRASRLLVRNGVPVPLPVDSPLTLLTAGERRVVELAATGSTNREIAQQLFVTVKAVEWHLSNAYRKLGITSRAQLPDLLVGHSVDDPRDPFSSSAR